MTKSNGIPLLIIIQKTGGENIEIKRNSAGFHTFKERLGQSGGGSSLPLLSKIPFSPLNNLPSLFIYNEWARVTPVALINDH
jgi:hypothetical protein